MQQEPFLRVEIFERLTRVLSEDNREGLFEKAVVLFSVVDFTKTDPKTERELKKALKRVLKRTNDASLGALLLGAKLIPVLFNDNSLLAEVFDRIEEAVSRSESREAAVSKTVRFLNDLAELNSRAFLVFFDLATDGCLKHLLAVPNLLLLENLILLKSHIAFSQQFVNFMVANATDLQQTDSAVDYQRLIVCFMSTYPGLLGYFVSSDSVPLMTRNLQFLSSLVAQTTGTADKRTPELLVNAIACMYLLTVEATTNKTYTPGLLKSCVEETVAEQLERVVCYWLSVKGKLSTYESLSLLTVSTPLPTVSFQLDFIIKTLTQGMREQGQEGCNLGVYSQLMVLQSVLEILSKKTNEVSRLTSFLQHSKGLKGFGGFNFRLYQKNPVGFFDEQLAGEFNTSFSVTLNEVFEHTCASFEIMRKFNVFGLVEEGVLRQLRNKNEFEKALMLAVDGAEIDKDFVVVKLFVEVDYFGEVIRDPVQKLWEVENR